VRSDSKWQLSIFITQANSVHLNVAELIQRYIFPKPLHCKRIWVEANDSAEAVTQVDRQKSDVSPNVQRHRARMASPVVLHEVYKSALIHPVHKYDAIDVFARMKNEDIPVAGGEGERARFMREELTPDRLHHFVPYGLPKQPSNACQRIRQGTVTFSVCQGMRHLPDASPREVLLACDRFFQRQHDGASKRPVQRKKS